MVVGAAIITQCTMTLTLCINVAWCCDEPVSYVLRHPALSILLHCLPAFSPSWRAGSSGSQDGSHFPRIHTHTLRTVCYNMVKGTLFHKKNIHYEHTNPNNVTKFKKI